MDYLQALGFRPSRTIVTTSAPPLFAGGSASDSPPTLSMPTAKQQEQAQRLARAATADPDACNFLSLALDAYKVLSMTRNDETSLEIWEERFGCRPGFAPYLLDTQLAQLVRDEGELWRLRAEGREGEKEFCEIEERIAKMRKWCLNKINRVLDDIECLERKIATELEDLSERHARLETGERQHMQGSENIDEENQRLELLDERSVTLQALPRLWTFAVPETETI